MKPCLVIPFFNHAAALPRTLAELRGHGLPCWLVDDGSDEACRETLERVAQEERDWLTVLSYRPNAGKGQAVMTGLEAALRAGCTHALQIDADGQHDASDVPHLVAMARRHPDAVVTGIPVYDDSVPRSRLYGRYVTHVWVWINTLSLRIRDSMCGFRIYPIAAALQVWREEPVGRRMDFDTEILVRLFWRGTDVLSLPTRVRYPLDGISHFDLWRDNLRISRMHARLFFGMLARLPRLLSRRLPVRSKVAA